MIMEQFRDGCQLKLCIAFNSVTIYISVLTIGLERILAMVIHLGLTMIVLYGIKFSKKTLFVNCYSTSCHS